MYLSTQDPAQPPPAGYNDKTSVSVWGRSGRVKVSDTGHMCVKVCMYVMLLCVCVLRLHLCLYEGHGLSVTPDICVYMKVMVCL